MSSVTISRGPEIDTDKCVTNAGSRYDLVILAAARAREIRRSNRSSVRREHVFTVVTALNEIQNGTIGQEYRAAKIAVNKRAVTA